MKNDVIFFAIMFAVAWIGFLFAKDRIPALASKPFPETTTSLSAQPDSPDPSESGSGKKRDSKAASMMPDDKSATSDDNESAAPTDSSTPTNEDPSDDASPKDPSANKASDDDPFDEDIESNEDRESKDRESEASENLKPEERVEQVLTNQVKAWNRGDLDGFMAGYWNDPELTFSGGGSTTNGWKETYASYRKRYPKGKMGTIKFLDLETEMVGEQAAITTGRFEHKLPNENVKGSFSLVLKKFDNQWKITHDHTAVPE